MSISIFDTNVFVNCPYDDYFRPLLRPLLFTVLRAGLNPRMAAERLNSGETRFSKIVELVRESKYAIHDLSRIKAKRAGEYFRFNMPFELGLDVGCSCFGTGEQLSKRCLILEKEPYRYQIALSDLSNSDIAAHHDEPVRVVANFRNWMIFNFRLHRVCPIHETPLAHQAERTCNHFMIRRLYLQLHGT